MSRCEKTVYDVVVATISDRVRMRRMLDKGNLTKEQAADFSRKLAALDNAMIAVCEGESHEAREALLSDIAHRRGYENAEAKRFYTARNTFDRRKAEAVTMIARMLGLI